MESHRQVILTGGIAFLGVLPLLGLTVYPLQYGLVESALLALVFVGLAIFEFVLDDTSF